MNYLELAKAKGGFTLNSDGQPANLEHGYMVSFALWETVFDMSQPIENIFNAGVAGYLHKAKECAAQVYVGAWISGGNLSLDLSKHVEKLDVAINLGRYWQQKAIFDCSSGQSIYL